MHFTPFSETAAYLKCTLLKFWKYRFILLSWKLNCHWRSFSSLLSVLCNVALCRQPPPGAARDLPAAADSHQHPPAATRHLHLPHQELHAGCLTSPLLHTRRRRQRPAAGGAGRVHQPGGLSGYRECHRWCSCTTIHELILQKGLPCLLTFY